MKELWLEHRKIKKARHRAWRERNIRILQQAGASFIDKGETLLFREPGKPKIDFYPSTGRWKCEQVFYTGGASAFLQWYNRQRNQS